jgi:Fe2+ transport system protein FeoA
MGVKGHKKSLFGRVLLTGDGERRRSGRGPECAKRPGGSFCIREAWNCHLQPRDYSLNFLDVKHKAHCSTSHAGPCQPALCPLNKVKAGMAVRIKQLAASPEMSHRLRELGFCEEQQIKLLQQESNIICLVCNARLAISTQLAESILVEPLPLQERVA